MGSASSRLVGRGSVYTLASAGPMLTGLLVTPVLTRAMPVQEYGVVALAIVVMQFLIGVLALGLPLVITRHVFAESSGDVGARSLAVSGGGLVLLLAALATGLIAVTGQLAGDLLAPAFLLAVLSGGAGAGIAMAQAWAVAHDRGLFYVGLAFFVSLVAPLAGLSAVVVAGPDATTYFVASASVFLLVDLAALVLLLRRGPVSFSRRELGRSLRIGLPLVPHQVAVGSATGAAVLVAGAVLGVSAGAHTQIAVYLGTVPLIVTSALSYAWTPIILSAPAEQVGPRLAETARTVGWLAAFGGVSVALLSPWLLRIIASAEYDRAAMVPITAAVALVAAVSVVFLAHTQLVVASGRTGPFGYLSPLALLVGTGSAWGLTELVGLRAAGVGYVVTYALLAVAARGLARRVSVVRWDERVLVAPLAFAVAGCALAAVLGHHDLGAAARIVAGVATVALGARTLLRALHKGTET